MGPPFSCTHRLLYQLGHSRLTQELSFCGKLYLAARFFKHSGLCSNTSGYFYYGADVMMGHDIFSMRVNVSSWRGTKLTLLILPVAAILMTGIWQVKGEVTFSAGIDIHSPGDFYTTLSPYGQWIELPPYGRCWRPAQVESGWRPYTSGHWEWTDCGWYWVSDEPWAWACYHYGSWVYDPTFGWLWIPGTEWAPAWVVWREAPDYIGWAPCGPGGAVLPASSFVFIDAPHFHDRIRRDRLIVNNNTIINRTRVINNISRETRSFDGNRERVVVNRGPGIDPIQRATGTRFATRPVREVARQTPVPQTVHQERPAGQVRTEPERSSQEPPAAPTGRQSGPIYREPTTPPPTGGEEQRIYREPTPQPPRQQTSQSTPEPQPRQAPQQVTPPPAQPTRPPHLEPAPSVPQAPPPPGRPAQAPGQAAAESGRGRDEAPPRAEPPAARPAPPTLPPQPQGPPPGQERGRGQDKKDGE